MRQNGSFGILVFVIIAGLGGALSLLVNGMAGNVPAIVVGVAALVVAMIASSAKENATIVIVPSTAVESMQLGGLAGMTALTMGLGQERANGAPASPGRLPEQANGHQELALK